MIELLFLEKKIFKGLVKSSMASNLIMSPGPFIQNFVPLPMDAPHEIWPSHFGKDDL